MKLLNLIWIQGLLSPAHAFGILIFLLSYAVTFYVTRVYFCYIKLLNCVLLSKFT